MSGAALGGPGRGAGMLTGGRVAAALLAAGLATVAALGARGTLPGGDARIIAIVFTCIVLWATGAVASLWVSLLFFFLAVTCTSVPTAEIFSGFGSSAFWLVFSGAAIGFALKESGLSERIGIALARRIGGSYLKALLAFAILSFLLSLVMPSTFGRIAILIPIAIGYCDVVKLGAHANGRRASRSAAANGTRSCCSRSRSRCGSPTPCITSRPAGSGSASRSSISPRPRPHSSNASPRR